MGNTLNTAYGFGTYHGVATLIGGRPQLIRQTILPSGPINRRRARHHISIARCLQWLHALPLVSLIQFALDVEAFGDAHQG
jgi:hypothetical protein